MIIIKQKTANHIMNADDLANIVAGHFVIFEMSNAGAITLTVPQQSDLAIPDGAVWGARQTGDGTLTIVGADSMTLTSTSGGLTAPTKNVLMTFEKRGSNDVIVQNGAPPPGAWTSWIPDVTGFGSIATLTGAYFVFGTIIHVRAFIIGTSNDTGFTITNLPRPAKDLQRIHIRCTNNTTDSIGIGSIPAGSSVMTLRPTASTSSTWSGSAVTKNADFYGSYEGE